MSTQRQIAKRSGVIAFFTLLSRITGLVRDAAVAYVFGTQMSADAFYVAFRIPNLLRSLLAEGSLTQAFVPVFTDTYKRNPQDAKVVVNASFTVLTIILFIVVGVGIWGSDALVSLVAGGFRDDPDKMSLTITLTRILFPYLGLVSLMALAMGILNSLKKFAAPAFAPILLNIGMIIGALVLTRSLVPPIYGLAIGALLGGILQCLCQIPSLAKTGYLPRFTLAIGHPRVRQIGKLMLPAVYGSAVYQLNVLAITYFASTLSEGAVSILWYAGRIMEFPLGVFAIAIATAILPSFSDCASDNNKEKFKETLYFGLEMVAFINIPAALGLYLLAEPITVLLLHRGAFDEMSAIETARALQAFAVGLPFISATRILVGAYYALQKSRIPVLMATVAVVVNVVACLLLRGPLGHVGLALATSLSSIANAFGLFWYLHRYLGTMQWTRLGTPLVKTIFTSIIMGIGLILVAEGWGGNLYQMSLAAIALYTLATIAAGSAVYFLVNLRNPLLRATLASIKRR